MNRQQVLPLVQVLALPLYWLTGRLLGLGATAAGWFAFVAPFGTHVLVVGIGFIVSFVNQHEEPGFRFGRRRDWVVAYVREAAESLRQFYWLMPFREGFQVPAPTAPMRLPSIVLIHGYGCNRGLWLPAVRWFSRQGYRVSAISLHPQHCPIERYGQAIADEIARVDTDAGSPGVALVCHSMGGLAARAYLRQCADQGRDPRLAALVTLGTPHRGTHLARVGLGENARQMRYGARWLDELGFYGGAAATSPASEAGGFRITTITSLHDNIVSRPFEQRLRLPTARAIFVRRQGHMSLATSPRILRLIDRILQRSVGRRDRQLAAASPHGYSTKPGSFEPPGAVHVSGGRSFSE